MITLTIIFLTLGQVQSHEALKVTMIFKLTLIGLFTLLSSPSFAAYQKTEEQVEGGTHWRCRSDRGPIHIWIPKGYQRQTAGAVVFVHGYASNVDQTWSHFKLAKQFSLSRQNAMFIVPEAPKSKGEAVVWSELGDLRAAVRACNIRLPNGSWVILGHSGAYRTVREWIDHPRVAELILLDALYSGQEEFQTFIETKGKKLIILSKDTGRQTRGFLEKFPYAQRMSKLPDSYEGFTRNQKRAKLLHIRSQYSHGGMVSNLKVLPILLRLTPLQYLSAEQQ